MEDIVNRGLAWGEIAYLSTVGEVAIAIDFTKQAASTVKRLLTGQPLSDRFVGKDYHVYPKDPLLD